jgi:hypothetical protein
VTSTKESPTREQTEALAEKLWVKRGSPKNDNPECDWHEAVTLFKDPWLRARVRPWFPPEDLLWQVWAREELLPYLAIEATADSAALSEELTRQRRRFAREAALLVAVLDGAPESSRARYRPCIGSSAEPARQAIEGRDQAFYRTCYATFSQFGGVLVDQEPCSLSTMHSLKPRAFQDGCAVVFETKHPVQDAIAAATRLRRVLAEANAQQNLSWADQFHARLSIGSGWREVVEGLPDARRDMIVVASASLSHLDPVYRRLLFAGGVEPAQGHAASHDSQEPVDAAVFKKVSKYLHRIPGNGGSDVPGTNPLGGRNGR